MHRNLLKVLQGKMSSLNALWKWGWALWKNFEGAATPVAVGEGSCLEDLALRLALSGFPGANCGMCSLQASCGKEELALVQSKRLINKMRGSVSPLALFLIDLSLSVSRGSVMCYICINPCKSVQGARVPSSVTEPSACPGGRGRGAGPCHFN